MGVQGRQTEAEGLPTMEVGIDFHGQAPFELLHLRSQQRHLHVQRSDQVVFLGKAESVKIGQGFHEPLFLLQQSFVTP